MTCRFCKQINCSCVQNIITITDLLGRVLLRLSDEKKREILGELYDEFDFEISKTSNFEGLIQGKPCIDKLNFKLKNPIQREIFNNWQKDFDIRLQRKRLSEESGCFWEVIVPNMREAKFFIKQPFKDNYPIETFVTNPSAFSNFEDYHSFLSSLLVHNKIEINRLDLAIDYKSSYEKLREGLDCKLLRVNTNYSEHISQGGQDTGMYFGKGKKIICVYDWSKKHRSEEQDITRVELRLNGIKDKKLSIDTISNFIKNKIESHPFKQIELNNIEFEKEDNFPDKKEKRRYNQFKTLIESNGYYFTRKKLELKTNRNFTKQYGKFFTLNKNLYQQPTDALLDLDIKIGKLVKKSASGIEFNIPMKKSKNINKKTRLRLASASKECIESATDKIETLDKLFNTSPVVLAFNKLAESVTNSPSVFAFKKINENFNQFTRSIKILEEEMENIQRESEV